MDLEIFAVLLGAAGGIAGVFGNTFDETRRKITLTGWIALVVVVAGAAIASVQWWKNQVEFADRQARQVFLSYQALIDVYGPLTELLDTTRTGATRDRKYTFPPDLAFSEYERLRVSKNVRDFVNRLSSGVAIGNRPVRRDQARIWAERYGNLPKTIDTTIATYGSHVSPSVLEHLVALRSHSFFNYWGRPPSSTNPCSGSIEHTVAAIAGDEGLTREFRQRCEQVLEAQLTRALEDNLVLPPWTDGMEVHHRAHCQSERTRARRYCGTTGAN